MDQVEPNDIPKPVFLPLSCNGTWVGKFSLFVCCVKKSQWNNLILSAFFCDLILSGLRWIKRVHNKVTFAQIEEGFDCKLAL